MLLRRRSSRTRPSLPHPSRLPRTAPFGFIARWLTLVVFLTPLIGGCGSRGPTADSQPRGAVTSPLQDISVEALAAMDRDCLQYPVERRSDGSEVWHADYVYFYLVHQADGSMVEGPHGEPLASGLLHSEVVQLMEKQSPIPGTGWRWRVQRVVRLMKGGETTDEAPVIVDDADLDEILARDRAAREG